MKKSEIERYKKLLLDVGNFMIKNKYTCSPLPKVILDDTIQDDDVLCYTGFFDPNENAVRLFTKNRLLKDVLRTWAHELIHWRQQHDGTIAKNKYNSTKIIEDSDLIKLEKEAYLNGNIAFRSWTETKQQEKE